MRSTKAAACDAPSSRTLCRPGFARHPIVVGPVEANTAKLELALHAAQLRIGYRVDHVLQIAVDAAESGTRAAANTLSIRPAKPIARRVHPVDKMRAIIIVVDQIAIFIVAC